MFRRFSFPLVRGLSTGISLWILVLLVSGCEPSPAASGEALVLGASLALTVRQMLRTNTWPKQFSLREPGRTILATGLGALAAILTAVDQGRSWTDALGAAIAGLPALLQGLAETAVPRSDPPPAIVVTKVASEASTVPKACVEAPSPPLASAPLPTVPDLLPPAVAPTIVEKKDPASFSFPARKPIA